MSGNKKVLLIIFSMLFLLITVVTIIISVVLRNSAQEKEIHHAQVVASLVRDGLTSHMISGVMDKREIFLKSVKESLSIQQIHIFRSDKVIKQYGKGYADESTRDEIENKTIKTRKTQKKIFENLRNATLRISVPYIATNQNDPQCLKCHTNAKEGDVLGGISLTLNLSATRTDDILTIIKILGFALIAMIAILYITNNLLEPYIHALEKISKALEKISKGDYSVRIGLDNSNDSNNVYKWLNTHFEKLEKTVSSIESNLSMFVADRRRKFKDPLEKSQFIIKDIAMIYKFKRIIEQDISKDIIYHRLIKIFKEQLNLGDLSFYEVDIKNDKRVLIYDDTPDKFCEKADIETSKHCRAYRTNSVVISDDFADVCQACTSDKEYLCINYPIDSNISLIINIKPKDRDELHENEKAIGYIKNYLESIKPVLQSKILTEILQKSNMIDGLTNLYNRKYLDIFMDKDITKHNSFAIAMLDIDFFKKVNDTYGHDAGDKVLKKLSLIFKKEIKNKDIAFRFGGEEFLIFIPDISTAEDTIENIRTTFEKTAFNINSEELTKTLSAGISFFIKCADLALYEAKNSGRNRTILFESI